jgi:hypothetical protein
MPTSVIAHSKPANHHPSPMKNPPKISQRTFPIVRMCPFHNIEKQLTTDSSITGPLLTFMNSIRCSPTYPVRQGGHQKGFS